MNDLFGMTGPSLPPARGGAPDSLVILLHGVGADGNDLIAIGREWAGHLPGTEFVSPHAPFPYDMAPFGRQWFSLRDRSPERILAGVQATAPILNGYIDAALADRGLTDDRLALFGFSQGTMMTLYVAPRRERACAAVVGCSGALMGSENLPSETTARPPVLLMHGSADDVVAPSALGAAEQALAEAGFNVEAHLRPGLGHGIDPFEVDRAGAFLAEKLGAGGPATAATS